MASMRVHNGRPPFKLKALEAQLEHLAIAHLMHAHAYELHSKHGTISSPLMHQSAVGFSRLLLA
jgi:hypothetical protein